MTGLKKIIVVDDEAGIRNLLSDVLSDESFFKGGFFSPPDQGHEKGICRIRQEG